MFSTSHHTRWFLEWQQSGIFVPLLMGRANVTVLMELLKDLQHEPVCSDLVYTKLCLQGSCFNGAHLNLTNMKIILVVKD
jgi:hypothetical protein